MNYTPDQTARYIMELYRRYGHDDYIGEPVSQLEHMVQCAQLAETEGFDEEVILAAFFHDIGHFCEHVSEVEQMDGFGAVDHEKLGADFLREHHFSERIASLVQNHVQAKRYLVSREPGYYDRLSEASRQTLEFQGGRMSDEEADRFEADPLFNAHIRLRRWDEMAKREHQPVGSLDRYEDMILRHLNR